jgi:hypothetical protein
MRNLLGVAAFLALALWVCACGGGSSSGSTKEEVRQPAQVKPAKLPPYRAPKVDGHTFNIEIVWWKPGKGKFIPETVVWTKRDLVNKPGLAHLTATSKGIRIKLSSLQAKAVKVKLWYSLGHGTTKCFSWHGHGAIPLVPPTKLITVNGGKAIRANLVEISLDAYDPRFLGPHKPRTYPGVVNIPPGVTESVG